MPAPAYDPVQFPVDISYGATGGSVKPTRLVVMPSGREQRLKLWTMSRRRYQIDMKMRTQAQASALVAFWEARDGPLRGFRYKDWTDFQVTNEPLANTGLPTMQLTRTYTSGSQTRTRNIYAPVASPAVTMRKNAGAFAGFSLDITTGLVTLTAVNSKAITAITQAASAVVTVGASHGFAVNDRVYFSGVVGMTQINGLVGNVTATGATTITVNINSTAFSAYTSGGTAAKYMTTTDTFDWAGEFDVPVRFDMQQMDLTQVDCAIRDWDSISLIELTG